MRDSGYSTYPEFFTLSPKLFSPNSEVGREKQNKIILFCYSLPTLEFGEKIHIYQNDHLKLKSKFLCIQSLVVEVKGLKQGYIFKNRPFYISFVLFHFQAGLNIP